MKEMKMMGRMIIKLRLSVSFVSSGHMLIDTQLKSKRGNARAALEAEKTDLKSVQLKLFVESKI